MTSREHPGPFSEYPSAPEEKESRMRRFGKNLLRKLGIGQSEQRQNPADNLRAKAQRLQEQYPHRSPESAQTTAPTAETPALQPHIEGSFINNAGHEIMSGDLFDQVGETHTTADTVDFGHQGNEELGVIDGEVLDISYDENRHHSYKVAEQSDQPGRHSEEYFAEQAANDSALQQTRQAEHRVQENVIGSPKWHAAREQPVDSNSHNVSIGTEAWHARPAADVGVSPFAKAPSANHAEDVYVPPQQTGVIGETSGFVDLREGALPSRSERPLGIIDADTFEPEVEEPHGGKRAA